MISRERSERRGEAGGRAKNLNHWQRFWLWTRRVLVGLAALAVVAALTVVLVVRHYEAELPSTAELKSYQPPQVTRVLARDGTLLGELYTERRTVVPLREIPVSVRLATLAAEDAGFYEHAGLNYLGMLRALLINLREGGKARQGGSTITQQVVKNVLLTPERTYERKIREVLLARRIEQELTKDEILELYLNHIYFGHGRWGIEEGSRYYFGKSVRDVTLGEAALLAGLVKGPSRYSPRVDRARALERRSYVLDQMVEKGFAEAPHADAARAEPVTLAPEAESLPELAPEVVDEVRRTLRTLVGPGAERGGYTITTTIDPRLQAAARAAVRRNLDEYAKRHKLIAPLETSKRERAPFDGTPDRSGHKIYDGVVVGSDEARGTLTVRVGHVEGTVLVSEAARYDPKGVGAAAFAKPGKVVRVSFSTPVPTPADADSEPAADGHGAPASFRLELGPQSALVAVDVRTREVLALVGSYEARRGGLDRASAARRQPGSTFKAFVYGYALHARTFTPASIVETNPAVLGGTYRPDNYDESDGARPKRLRDALAQSVNVAAVWTLGQVGATNVQAFANAAGIESKLGTDPSLALGAYEITVRELAGAFATFAAGGTYETPLLVTRITGPNGDVALPARPPARRVLEPAEAYVLTSMLQSVVESGTGRRARALKRPIAGKTGTSNKAKDAWFVGYSTDVACAVWTGYDDAVPLGAGEAGASAALPAFVELMQKAHEGKPAAAFPMPPGVVRTKIDPATGLLAREDQEDAIDEVFVAGTEPTKIAEADAGADPDAAAADPADAGAPAAERDGGPDAAAPSAVVVPPGDGPPPF